MGALVRRGRRRIFGQADIEWPRMHVQETQYRIQVGDDVERIQREIGKTVVLARDDDRVELGVGRVGAIVRPIKDRDVETREPGTKATVGHADVSGKYEVDIGRNGSLRIPFGKLALLLRRNYRAQRVAINNKVVARVVGHRLLQIGHTCLDRLIAGEIDQPREFPPRLIRPTVAAGSANARIPEHELEKAEKPGYGPRLPWRGHRDRRDRPARISRRDELIHDDLDVGVVPTSGR